MKIRHPMTPRHSVSTGVLQYIAVCCRVLQCVAVCCDVMCQHINRKYRHVLCEWESRTNLTHTYTHKRTHMEAVLQRVAVRDSCESYTHIHTQTHTHGSGVAACCRVLQCAASCESHTHIHTQTQTHGSGALDSTVDRYVDTLHLQRTATHCNMLQHRKWRTWSVLQCVAVRCNVLQCVAACYNVLQCVSVCWHGSGARASTVDRYILPREFWNFCVCFFFPCVMTKEGAPDKTIFSDIVYAKNVLKYV